jgi:uncharacterized protein YacL
MATRDPQDTIVRIGCGAIVGLLIGLALLVGTASYFANSIVDLIFIVVGCVVVCAALGWRFGDRFFQGLHKWIGWFS